MPLFFRSLMPNIYLKGTVTIPSSLDIVSITQSFPMQITCVINTVTESSTYSPGMLVKLFIPSDYGMLQANGLTVKILTADNINFIYTVNVDSTNFDAFVIPASGQPQPASMAPSGSQNLEFSNQTNQVGFQSLNNQGN